MAFKSLLLVSFLIASVTAPVAAEAQAGLAGGLWGLIRIQGTVFCSTSPVFPNAQGQLQCGAGNVVSSTTTNGSGSFSIVLDPLQYALSALVTGCDLVVKTPLSNCNANLPSVGGLLSPLQSVGKHSCGGSSTFPTLFPLDFNSSLP